jgi:rubrerythrin
MPSSTEWKSYYQQNAQSLLEIPWHLGAELTPEEKIAVSQSVKEFQAGENSEGKHLYQDAQKYSEQTGDQDYVAAIKMFIAEEQRHARDLARFLTLNKIPLVKTTFTDVVFRKLRHLFGGLEISIAVLITAEIIAKVYYAALREATKSKILIGLCDQILRDEVKHVQFQSEQLSKLRSKRNYLGLIWTMGLQRFLFFGTVFVVWLFHRKVFLRGSFSFQRYWQTCWREFNEAF